MHGLTFEAHYALVALVAMARQDEGSVLQMREISAREKLPAPFLSKILLKLRHAGLVQSRHGRGGGYSLAKPPDAITVQDVLSACRENPVAFNLGNRAISANPPLARGLRKLNRKIQRALEATSVAELAGLRRKAAGETEDLPAFAHI